MAAARNTPPWKKTRPQNRDGKKPRGAPSLRGHARSIIPESPTWYTIPVDLPVTPSARSTHSLAILKERRDKARDLLEAEAAAYVRMKEHSPGSSDDKWLTTVMQSGTAADKTAAMTMAIQQSAVHRIQLLRQLLKMATKKGKREALLAINVLRDLFINNLLPPNRKLKYFEEHDGIGDERCSLSDTQLIMWYFEGELKKLYLEFLGILEVLTKDELAYFREQALKIAEVLLEERPEQEQMLLAVLVNKFGDLDKKVASKVVVLLNSLLERHPRMKLVVIREVEKLIVRPHIDLRAVFYAVVFLSGINLSPKDKEATRTLIDLYFAVFNKIIALPGDDDKDSEGADTTNKQLTGNKKANSRHKHKSREDHKRSKKKGGNKSGFHGDATLDKHSRLLSALLTGVNRALPFARDAVPLDMLDRHVDTLFKIVALATFNKSAQALLLLFQIWRLHGGGKSAAMASHSTTQDTALNTFAKSLGDRFYRALYAKLLAPDLRGDSPKHALFLNVTYKALRNDSDIRRLAAFTKRLLQVASAAKPAFACGALIVVSEALRAKPQLKKWASKHRPGAALPSANDSSEKNAADSAAAATDGAVSTPTSASTAYDPKKREPQYANAVESALWELAILVRHFHPSVSKFAVHVAQQLGYCPPPVDGESAQPIDHNAPIQYAGDPLKDFTLTAFLDRFVYRNPKKKLLEHAAETAERPHAIPRWRVAPPVNSPEFVAQSADTVREEEKFFHQYFRMKIDEEKKMSVLEEKRRKKKKRRDEDDELLDKAIMEDFEEESSAEEKDSGEEGNYVGMESDTEMLDASESEGEGNGEESDEDEGGYDYEDLARMSDDASDEAEDSIDVTDEQAVMKMMEREIVQEEQHKKKPEQQEQEEDESDEEPIQGFAAADEFEDIMEEASKFTKVHPKQQQWEEGKWKKKRNTASPRKRKRSENSAARGPRPTKKQKI